MLLDLVDSASVLIITVSFLKEYPCIVIRNVGLTCCTSYMTTCLPIKRTSSDNICTCRSSWVGDERTRLKELKLSARSYDFGARSWDSKLCMDQGEVYSRYCVGLDVTVCLKLGVR